MKTENSRRILALFLPFLSAERMLAKGHTGHSANAPDIVGQPFALTENRRGARILAAVDRQAWALGIRPGMRLADARARLPELLVWEHDPSADARLLESMAGYCDCYTPAVAIRPPQALILDMTGCLHLHGSQDALTAIIEGAFDAAGFSLRHAFAASAEAALALAQHGLKEGAEMQLPVSALAVEERSIEALERAGLYSIGDLAARPRAPLAARFGNQLVMQLERILGQQDSPVDPRQIQAAIRVERRFAEPLGELEKVERVFCELFFEAAILLEERQMGARLITMSLLRCDGCRRVLSIETGAPTRDGALFRRLLAERLDSLNDPLDPGFGYDLLRLSISLSEALQARQITMEGEDNDAGDIAALLGQLGIRLGRDAVQRFAPADSHMPEHGLCRLPALDGLAANAWPQPTPGEPPLRPLFLFDPPQRITVLAQVPDGPPRRFGWRKQTHLVVFAEGPERIANQWWKRRKGHLPGQGGLTRDYYRVEDSEGRRFWLFRRGLYGSESANPEWYLHGLFA